MDWSECQTEVHFTIIRSLQVRHVPQGRLARRSQEALATGRRRRAAGTGASQAHHAHSTAPGARPFELPRLFSSRQLEIGPKDF